TVDPVVTCNGTGVASLVGNVTVGANATADFGIQLIADPTIMTRAHDANIAATTATGVSGVGTQTRNWVSETSGYVVLTPQAGGTVLRVPYYGALTPASAMNAAGIMSTHGGSAGTGKLALQGAATDTTAIATTPNDGV